jgi:Cysteine dioxygenase type I
MALQLGDPVPAGRAAAWPMTAQAAWRAAVAGRTLAERPVGADDLAGVVARFASAGRLWRPYVRHDLFRRWYVRLAWTPEHEVWLLCWEVGHAVELHDHGGSAGAFVVAEGVLREEHVDGAGLRRIRCRPGTVRSFAAGHVHTVWNPGPGAATSIHAYAPPLRSMTFYAHDPAAGLQATHVELVPKTVAP